MWCWRSPQVRSHQGRDEAVASQLKAKIERADYISFLTIVTNYNGPLAADIARIDVATHVKELKYGASSTLILTLIRPHTRLHHRGSLCSAHELFQSTSILSLPTIMGHYLFGLL